MRRFAAHLILAAMANLDSLVEELERSYAELQERMADPSVYSDRREAADLGPLTDLEPAVTVAREWQQMSADLVAAKDDPELASLADGLADEVARLEDELRLALVERTRPTRRT